MLPCGAGCCLWTRGFSGAGPGGPSGALNAGGGEGFALHEALRERVAGVSDPRVVQFPPFGGGEAVT